MTTVLGFNATDEQRQKIERIRMACASGIIKDHDFELHANIVSKSGVHKAAFDEGMKVLEKRYKKQLAAYDALINTTRG